MTDKSNQENEERFRQIDRLEVELIEADIVEILGRPSDYFRIYAGDTEKRDAADVVGWTIYGDVHLDRDMLPVFGRLTDAEDDPDHRTHRRQILEVIAGAHAAGRGDFAREAGFISAEKVMRSMRVAKAFMDDGIERFKATVDTLDIAPEKRESIKARIDQSYAEAKDDLAGRAA